MRSKSLLLVEDEQELLEVVKELLEMEGWTVYKATGGEEAVGLWNALPVKPDVVLADLRLGRGGSGHQLVQRLTQEVPATKVVLMSGHFPETFDVPRSYCCINKPFAVQELRKALEN